MTYQHEYAERLGFWVVIFLGTFAWAPAMYPGYWQALEGFVPVFSAVQSSPISSIATVPDLWRGTGSTTFLFAQPWLLLGSSPVAAVRATFALCFVLGGLGMYAWLRPKLGDRPAGLAGIVFMVWPPFLATVYIRGSLDDAVLFALLPLALAGVSTYAATRSIMAAAIITFSILIMWRAQAGLAVFVTVMLLCYSIVVERSLWTTIVTSVSGVAGLVSLIPLWDIQSNAEVNFSDHFVYPFQLIYGNWQVSPSIPGWQDDYPFQLGFPILLLVPVAIWLWFRDQKEIGSRPLRRFLLFCLGAIIVVLILVLPVSATLWSWVGMSRLLEYPWQILLLAGPFLASVVGLLPVVSKGLQQVPYWSTLVLLAILGSLPFLTAEYTTIAPPEVPVGVFGARNEILLLDVRLAENPAEAQVDLDIVWQVLQTSDIDYNVFFQALERQSSAPAVISQLDTQPLQGRQPATTWQPGDIFTDTYRLDVAQDDLLQRQLRYHFGYYDWRSGERMPFNGGIDDKLEIYGQ